MTEKRSLRVALIGQGFMGRAHSNAYNQVGHFFDLPYRLERTVICGRDTARLDKMAATWGWAETANDWRAVIDRKDIDVVDVAVPNHMHAPIVIAAAEAGKIVLCEKPLANSVEEAERMVAAASKVRTMVWHNYRRAPAVQFAHQLIQEGKLGQIFHYRGQYLQEWGNDPTRPPNWKTDKAQAGSGVVGDILSHSLDTALMLNGPIASLNAMTHTFAPGREIDDAASVTVRFANGSIGTFESSRYAVGCLNRNAFEIHGSKGMLHFDLEDMNRLDFHDATEARNLQGTRSIIVTGPDHPYWKNFWKPGHIIGYEHTFIAALADFVTSLAVGSDFHPDFEDGLAVQKLIAAIQSSAASGTWVTL